MEKQSKNIIITLIILFVILMLTLIIFKIRKDTDKNLILENKRTELFSMLEKNKYINVTKYLIYGNHFNIEGTLDTPQISGISINSVNLVARNLDGEEISIPSHYNYSDNILAISSIEKINSGLDLETLNLAEYYLMVKISYSNSDIKYYSLKNSSEYSDYSYYTITKNNTNKQIDINFSEYNSIPYMNFKVSNIDTLPDDVYDIVIDPGHGGNDSGAVSNNYKESDIVLECSQILKSKLETLGLKVLLSRENLPSNVNTTINMYDNNGRITVINEAHPKLMISLHINSDKANAKTGGLEVYAPNDSNLDLAKSFAQNIVTMANTTYSAYSGYKKADGVYVKNFNNADILAFTNRAKKDGYEPYSITTSTPYLYTIREVGGIATNAFVDGRNKSYGTNKYCKSNIGVEGYSIELGYMANSNDLNNIISNKSSYMEAIFTSIKNYYNL